MPKPWRLTRQAEESLTHIAAWTRQNFGDRQADHYAETLVETCKRIAGGTAVARSCQIAIDPDLPPELLVVRSDMHLVVFVDLPETIVIVDFVHGRRDLPRRLKGLIPDD